MQGEEDRVSWKSEGDGVEENEGDVRNGDGRLHNNRRHPDPVLGPRHNRAAGVDHRAPCDGGPNPVIRVVRIPADEC